MRARSRQAARELEGDTVGSPGPAGTSISVGRDAGAVVVRVQGALDQASASLLHHIVRDLVVNQGNIFVRVDADPLVASSVLAELRAG